MLATYRGGHEPMVKFISGVLHPSFISISAEFTFGVVEETLQ
jgi:hypothetical protein